MRPDRQSWTERELRSAWDWPTESERREELEPEWDSGLDSELLVETAQLR